MHLVAFIVSLLSLLAQTCLAGLFVDTSELDKWRLVEATIDILESCYTDRFSTVGLAGPSAGSILTRMSLADAVIPVTMVDYASMVENNDTVERGSRYKLQIFVITTTNQSALPQTLEPIKTSKWWNHMASFILIDSLDVENECSNAHEVLSEAWSLNLLNSKFVCFHRTRGHLIYTFNPYTSKAPAPWHQENTYEGINGHVWTLYAREHRADESRCSELDFDKTMDLGGYEIRASAQGMENWWYADPDKETTVIDRIHNISAAILMNSLNATWKVLSYPANVSTILDPMHDVIDGRSGICLNIVSLHSMLEFEGTYPFTETRLVVLTQYPGYKSQLEKITSVLDRSSHFGLLTVLTITLLFFKYWLRKPFIPAILYLVLIICNAALHTVPHKVAPRMYLGTLFIFVVTIQGIYQGKLASLLTQQVRLKNVDSVEDIVQYGYTVYGLDSHYTFFNHSGLESRYVELTDRNCTGHVLRDPKAACADTMIRLAGEAARFNLHLSRKTMGTVSALYLVQTDWPLQERVSAIFQAALSGGILELLYSKQLEREIRTVESYENQEHESTVKVLTFEHLTFAFVILAIGLGFASVTFILEVATFDVENFRPRNRFWGIFD